MADDNDPPEAMLRTAIWFVPGNTATTYDPDGCTTRPSTELETPLEKVPTTLRAPLEPTEYATIDPELNPANSRVPAGLTAIDPELDVPTGNAKGDPATAVRLPLAWIVNTEMLPDPPFRTKRREFAVARLVLGDA